MSATERTLRKALGALLRAAEQTVTDQTPAALERLDVAAAQARKVYWQAGPIIVIKSALPAGRRGPIGEHVLNGCGGAMWEVRKGDRWRLWCDRCGYIPKRWTVRRRVEEQAPEGERLLCGACLCFVPERKDCMCLERYTTADSEPMRDDCFIAKEG
jgi:hypothetical protein